MEGKSQLIVGIVNTKVPTGMGLVHILNWKGVGPYSQPERSQSISPTRRGLVHIPNRKGAGPYPQPERGWSISPTGKGPCKKCGRRAPYQKWPTKDARCVPGALTLPLGGVFVWRTPSALLFH